jgi:hypothetical protein
MRIRLVIKNNISVHIQGEPKVTVHLQCKGYNRLIRSINFTAALFFVLWPT